MSKIKKVTIVIPRCEKCPNVDITQDPSPDWFEFDSQKVYCKLLQRYIAREIRTVELDELEIPEDCPLDDNN